METIGDFVSRTGGPVVPFVAAWYPWAYAHHYLRGEVAQLPGELGTVGTSLSLEEARDLIELWCGHTGESIEDGARRLADAYLHRWGLHPSEPPTPSATQGTGATQAEPTRARQRRGAAGGAAGGAGQRSRATRAAAAAETTTAPRADDPYAMSVSDREG